MMESRMEWSKLVQRLSLRLPAKEMQIFSRLIYRNKNQHRRDRSFQKLTKVEKDFRKYYSHDLHFQVQKLVSLLPDVEGTPELSRVVSELPQCAVFVCQLLEFVETTFSAVLQQADMLLFQPFNLVMAASLSRLWFYLKVHLWAIDDIHTELQRMTNACSQVLKHVLDSRFHKFLPYNGSSVKSSSSPLPAQTMDDHSCTEQLLARRKQDFASVRLSTQSTDPPLVTANRRPRLRQPNSLLVVCNSGRRGRPCWKIRIHNKKIVLCLKAQKLKMGVGLRNLVATDLQVRHSGVLDFFCHYRRVTLRWARGARCRIDLQHLRQRKQSIQQRLDHQLPCRNQGHSSDIHNIQTSFLQQLEEATTAINSNFECGGGQSGTLTAANSHCKYSDTDIDHLFSAIDL